jgi:diguanylate cyclase
MTAHDHQLHSKLTDRAPDSVAELAWLDQIRHLLVRSGLPPRPEVYALFWAYVRDESHELSYAVETALATNRLDLAKAIALHSRHSGGAAARVDAEAVAVGVAAEVTELVRAAHSQAEALSQYIEINRNDVADYGRAIADGGAALDTELDDFGIARLLAQLGAATTAMRVANDRMGEELCVAAREAKTLSVRLGTAERAATTDSLTGVLNRRGTFDKLAAARAEARSGETVLSVAVIDIDHFKNFNDRFGHSLGDKVLSFVASHVRDRIALRGGVVGRIGGEEFIAILPGVDVMSASAIIDRVRAELACQIIRNAANGASLGRVTFSAGIAGDHPGDDCDTLVDRADKALYAAKRMGRDRVVPDRS